MITKMQIGLKCNNGSRRNMTVTMGLLYRKGLCLAAVAILFITLEHISVVNCQHTYSRQNSNPGFFFESDFQPSAFFSSGSSIAGASVDHTGGSDQEINRQSSLPVVSSTSYQRQFQSQQPIIPTYEQPQQVYSQVQYYSVPNSPVTSYKDPTELNRNRRHDNNDQDENGRRLLSSSQFNRITETLGALNTVGRYLVNMTRADSGTDKIEDEEEEEYEEDDDEEDDDDDDDTPDFFGFGDDSDEDEEKNRKRKLRAKKLKKKKNPLKTNKEVKTTSSITTSSTSTTTTTTTTEKSIGIEQRIDSVPEAILTLTSNVLGKNLTKTIEPLIKRVTGIGEKDQKDSAAEVENKKKIGTKINNNNNNKKKKREDIKNRIDTPQASPTISSIQNIPHVVPTPTEDIEGKDGEHKCKTPSGLPGKCEDLSSCPSLLLDLGQLRQSLCFKRLFVPGVCCPTNEPITTTILTTQRPPQPSIVNRPSLVLKPQKPIAATTARPPLIPVFTVATPENTPQSLIDASQDNQLENIIDPNECGQQEYTSGRIVGGTEAENGDWPWLAAIFLHGPKRTEFWCGGSLIGTKYILTAAHCTRDSRQRPFAPRQFTVRLGDIDLSTDGEPSAPVTFKVTEVRAHPRFSRVGFYNDIAIMVLDRPVRKSRYVIPVCLPKPNFVPTERLIGRRATVVGWGTTYYGGKESTVQRQADLPIWRNEDCNRAYFQPITENFLCAGFSEGGVDACQGDSGGPLMMKINARWTQLGIVSFGNKCGEPGYPGVYTRLSEYSDWIRETTKN